jgi:hypothetical protein
MDADLLFRHRARALSGVDDALTEVGKVYGKLHSRRERLSWPVRKRLMREQTAEKKIDDAVIASVSVREDRKIHPARIIRYDGLAKIFRVRPTVLVVERKRGKHVRPFSIRGSVVEVRHV